MDKTIRKIILHRSLLRPMLFAGGEKRLVLLNMTLIAVLLLGLGVHYITISLALFLATIGHWCLVQAAKADPMMSRIYLRHIQYQERYSATSSVHVKIKSNYISIPESISIY